MKKKLKLVLGGLVAVLIIAGVLVYFNLNRIVKQAIETQATDSLNLKTDVGSANLALFGGQLSIGKLQIASPSGYDAPHMLSLGRGDVEVNYSDLKSDPIHIKNLTFRKPEIVVEQKGGKFNFQTLSELLPKSDPNAQPTKLIIDQLHIEGATVLLRPGLPGMEQMKEIKVQVPNLELSNIGNGEGNQNGVAMKDLALLVMSSLADKAAENGNLSAQLKDALANGAKDVEKKVRGEVAKQLDQIDQKLKGTGLDGAAKDLTKGLLGGSDEKKTEKSKRR